MRLLLRHEASDSVKTDPPQRSALRKCRFGTEETSLAGAFAIIGENKALLSWARMSSRRVGGVAEIQHVQLDADRTPRRSLTSAIICKHL